MSKSKNKSGGNKGTVIVYIVLRLLVIAIMIREMMLGQWDGVFYCILTLFLFMIPFFVERKLRVELPTTLEIVVLLFIFAGEILGEIEAFFLKIPGWDLILHTTNGFMGTIVNYHMYHVLRCIRPHHSHGTHVHQNSTITIHAPNL